MSDTKENPLPLLLPYVREHATEGSPESVLAALDEFGWKKCWMMFIGERKGALLDNTVANLRPGARVLELG